jgi:hypothetical protein
MTNYAVTEYATAALFEAWAETQATSVTFDLKISPDGVFVVTVPAPNKTA